MRPTQAETAQALKIQKIKENLSNWRKTELSYLPTFEIVDACFLEDDVWAAGYRGGYGGYGRIIYSADGGKNWETLWSDKNLEALRVFFFSKTNGIAATNKTVSMTFDGGRRWDVILTVCNMPLFEILIIEDIEIKSPKEIVVRLRGGIGEAIETIDGGRSWGYVIYHGQRYGSRAVKLRTQNQGQAWQKVGGY
jgi:photosystem II stability/assembly factor-like uncharacterized protein